MYARGAHVYDADGDGYQDLLVLGSYKNIWLYHGNGTGDMGRAEVVCTMYNLPTDPRFLDVDQDGDPDLLGIWSGGGSGPDTLAWFENDGTGSFGERHFIAAPLNSISDHELADMDMDGDIDAVFISYEGNALVWCANGGNLVFGPPQPTVDVNGSWTLAVGDLDSDGDNDLAFNLPDTQGATWIRNLGNGTFTAAQTFSGLQVSELGTEDLDEDGDADLVARYSSTSGLFQFTNDGSGSLLPAAQIGPSGSLDGFVDINNDGIRDSWGLSTQFSSAGYSPGNGAGQFGPSVGLFEYTSITVNFLTWGDLNNDGALDMISMWYDDGLDAVWWQPNDGNGGFPSYNTPISRGMDAPRSIATGDIDGDGDEDLVAVMRSNLKISWLENNGTGQWAEHPIRSWPVGWTAGEQVNTGDADGDGDLDVLITTHDGLYTGSAYWNLNDGAGQFTDGPGFVGHATGYGRFRSVQVDLNQDGLMDLLAFKDSVYYWENIPGSPFHYAVGLTMSGEPGDWGFNSGDVGDVDGDGDVDIVVRGLALLENAGDMTFSAPQTIAEEDTGPIVRLADIDGDGDPDIVAQAGNPRAVVWWENDGGYFIERHAVGPTSGTDYEFALLVEDLDGDGDVDIAAPLENNAPAFYLNHGDGSYTAPVLLREPGGLCSALCSGDFNGDGLLDLAMGLDGTSIWTTAGYGGSPYQLSGTIYIDTDGDGVRDPGEAPLPGAQLLLDPPTGSAYVQADGSFTAHVAEGTYTISAIAPSEDWQPTAPVSHTVTVNSGTPIATGLDLGFWDPTPQDSLIVSITPSFLTCAGPVPLWATVVNTGTTTVSTSLHVGIDPLLDYVGADPTPDAILGDTLVWNADTLHPFGSRTVAITVNMPGASFAGDPVHTGIRAPGISLASGSALETIADRVDTITCGGVSNVKLCDTPSEGQEDRVPLNSAYLDYTILFQNTGTDTAHTVIVSDVPDALLLADGLVVIGSSHPFDLSVTDMTDWMEWTDCRFTFNDIDLPPAGVDPVGSEGFISVRFPIDQAHAQHGAYVMNTAHISFLGAELTTTTSYATVVLADCGLVPQPVIHDTVIGGNPYFYETSGEDAYDDYDWFLNGNLMTGGFLGAFEHYMINYDFPGVFTVQVTDLAGCTAISEPFAWMTTGITSANRGRWRLFPNPATGNVRILSAEPVERITLTDATGRMVADRRFAKSTDLFFPRDDLSPGLYHLLLRDATGARIGSAPIIYE